MVMPGVIGYEELQTLTGQGAQLAEVSRPGLSVDLPLMEIILLHLTHRCNSKSPQVSRAAYLRSTRRYDGG